MAASTPVMVAGYTNVSTNDLNSTTIPQGDGATAFPYYGKVLWLLTRVLLLCGAVCTGSSTRTSGTGTTANTMSASDQWSDGAYHTAYQGAWWACKITLGGVQYNLVLQSAGTTFVGGRGKISVGAGNEYTNSGGGVKAERPKTIAGEGFFLGGGTDDAPEYHDLPHVDDAFYVSACWDAATGYLAFAMTLAAGSDETGAAFVFAILPFDADTFLSTRSDRVFLCSPGTALAAAAFTEISTSPRCVYQCQKGISPEWAQVKPDYRVAVGTTSTDPGTGDKIDSLVSWKRDSAPIDTGGLTPDCIALGSVTAVPTMHDVKITPNSSTKRRYLCLGQIGLRFPNSFVSN